MADTLLGFGVNIIDLAVDAFVGVFEFDQLAVPGGRVCRCRDRSPNPSRRVIVKSHVPRAVIRVLCTPAVPSTQIGLQPRCLPALIGSPGRSA